MDGRFGCSVKTVGEKNDEAQAAQHAWTTEEGGMMASMRLLYAFLERLDCMRLLY